MAAKLADPTVDCRALKASSHLPGAFDARSACTKVIVPFDRANQAVLGGAPEPYVNNPLRIAEVVSERSADQKDKAGWADLCLVLGEVETRQQPTFTACVFDQVLVEIWRRLALAKVTYPAPLRIRLDACLSLIDRFLAERSGGDRAQAVAGALFRTIGDRFGLYSEVRRRHINAADAASGQVADLECVNADGEIIAAIEVKDKSLTIREVQDKLPRMREESVREIFFLALQGTQAEDAGGIASLAAHEFASGQNIYIFNDMQAFMATVLALLGEDGRHRFLQAVGDELDTYRSEITHRKAWAALLAQI